MSKACSALETKHSKENGRPSGGPCLLQPARLNANGEDVEQD